LDTVTTNQFGNKELTINDTKGGHVTIVKFPKELRTSINRLGYVESLTHNAIGGKDNIYTVQDIDDNIEGIKRINRINDKEKALLIDFLLDMRIELEKEHQ
jgi:hypothetical protein